MAEAGTTQLKCRLHEQGTYKLYCKDCMECICFQCLEDFHDKHTFCKLQGAENVIREDLKTISECLDEERDTIPSIRNMLKEKQEELCADKLELIKDVEDAANKTIQKINESKEKTISVLETEYTERDALIKKQLEQLDSFKSMTTNIDNKSIDLLIDTLMNIKIAFTAIKNFKTTKPRFILNELEISIGELNDLQVYSSIGVEELGVEPKQDVKNNIVDTEADTKDENSSDEIAGFFQTYPIVISDKNLKGVKKIIPISQNDAWILVRSNLRKLVSEALEDTIYAKEIKDFAVVSNKSILVLKTNERLIQEILISNGRRVSFADVGSGYVPCTVSVHKEFVFVNIGLENQKYTSPYLVAETLCKMSIFTLEGVPVSIFEISCIPNRLLPCLTFHIDHTENETIQYSIFRPGTFSPRESNEILKLIKTQSQPINILATYQGAFGVAPSASTFQCHGACVDDNGNVLVSDYKLKKVCVLDNNLKFKSVLISYDDVELTGPEGLAVSDGILWVADQEKIFKFKYNSKAVKIITG